MKTDQPDGYSMKPFRVVTLRISPELHGAVLDMASDEGVSMNQWLTQIVSKNVKRKEPPAPETTA